MFDKCLFFSLSTLLFCGAAPLHSETLPSPVPTLSAEQIMEKVSLRSLGEDSIANTQLIITDKKGRVRERTYKAFSQSTGSGRQNLMLVEKPKKLLNTGFLSIDQHFDEPQDKQWIYLPALKRSKPIATKNKDGRFMASDFSYYDMTLLNTQQQNFVLQGEEQLDNTDVWKISATPMDASVVSASGYTSSTYWVRKDPYLILKAEHQTSNKRRKKVFWVHSFKQIDDVWVIDNSEMKTFYKDTLQQSSVLRIDDIKFEQTLAGNLFTVRRLEQGL